MITAGIDYSISCPAICLYSGDSKTPKIADCHFYYLTSVKKYVGKWGGFTGEAYPKWTHPMERYDKISQWAFDKIHMADTVYIEDYGFNANGRITDLAEHTGVLKYRLWQEYMKYSPVSIGSVKKALTGKGNASKEQIGKIWAKEIPPVFTSGKSPIADCIDAYGVLLAGLR